MTTRYPNRDAFEAATWPAMFGAGSIIGEGASLLFGFSHGFGLIFAGVAFMVAIGRVQAALSRARNEKETG
jgi:hypothetical protein